MIHLILNDLYLRNTCFKAWLLINQKAIALNIILGVKCNHILPWWVCLICCVKFNQNSDLHGTPGWTWSFPKGCVIKINRKVSFPWLHTCCSLFGDSYRFKKAFCIEKSRNQGVNISMQNASHIAELLNSRLYQMNVTFAVCT